MEIRAAVVLCPVRIVDAVVDRPQYFLELAGSFGVAEDLGACRIAGQGQCEGGAILDITVFRVYPCTSPNVVCAGGTSVNRNGQHLFTNETTWSGSGGGPSKYEPEPAYQSQNITSQNSPNINLKGMRGAPDFSFDANPNTGVSVYDSTRCQGLSGWMVFGGTSVAAPSLAGIVNWAGSHYANSNTELSTIYSCYATGFSCYPMNFRDITSGSSAGSFSPQIGWDFVTGVGSNLGSVDK